MKINVITGAFSTHMIFSPTAPIHHVGMWCKVRFEIPHKSPFLARVDVCLLARITHVGGGQQSVD